MSKEIFVKYKLQMIAEYEGEYNFDVNLNSPRLVEELCKNCLELNKECEEVLYALALDVKNKVIGVFEVSRGAFDFSVVNPREVFKRLVLCNCSSFILVHNHPSMDTHPSSEDIKISKRIKDVGEILDIKLLDFCILGYSILSFRQEQLI